MTLPIILVYARMYNPQQFTVQIAVLFTNGQVYLILIILTIKIVFFNPR